MRILHVAACFAPAWAYGGVGRAVYEVARQQVRCGHQVTVLTTDALSQTERAEKKKEKLDGVSVWRVPNLSNWLMWHVHFCTPLTLPPELQPDQFDVIHLHEARSWLNYLVLRKLKEGTTVCFSAWGTMPYNDRLTWFKKCFDWIALPLFRSNVATAIGQNKHEVSVLRQFGIGKKQQVVPLGVDEVQFKKLPKRQVFRRKLGITNKTKLYLFLGRFSQAKGLELLFRSFAELSKKNPHQKMMLVCVGRDDGYLASMKQLIQTLGVSNILIHDPLYDRERFQAYVAADVFVFTPIVYEETSTACLEALGCGIPVITTVQAGMPFVAQKQGVWQVVARQSRVTAALQHTLTKKTPSTSLQRKKLIKTYFSWQSIVHQLDSIYGAHQARAV